MNPDLLKQYNERICKDSNRNVRYTISQDANGYYTYNAMVVEDEDTNEPEDEDTNEPEDEFEDEDSLNYKNYNIKNVIREHQDVKFDLEQEKRINKELRLKILNLEAEIRRSKQNEVNLLDNLVIIQNELNDFHKTHHIKKLSIKTIERKLKEVPCLQFGEKDKILFINFDEELKTEKDRDDYSKNVNDLLDKIEDTNISLVFTNSKVIFSKFNSEQLVGFGLKKVQAVRKVFID